MRGAIVIAAFGALLAASPAIAQDAAGIAGACTAEGGFGLRFGQLQTELAPSRLASANSRYIDLSGEWSAWKDVEAVVTPASRKLHTLNASLTVADAATARALASKVRESLVALGLRRESDEVYVSKPPAKPWRMEVSADGRTLNIVCADKTLRDAAFEELRSPPRLTAAPTPPTLTLPPLPSATACATPEARAATIQALNGKLREALDFGFEMNRYGDELARWKSQQFIDRGLWTKADQTNFHADMLRSAPFMAHFEASMKELTFMIGTMTKIAEAEKAGDQASECQASVEGARSMHRMIDSVRAHWAYMMERYDAEAKRLGVSIA